MLKERFTERRFDASERPRRFYEYFVTGHGPFPIDMLRHDGAWPATGEDAAKIEWSFCLSHSELQAQRLKTQSIKLWSHREPTIERWKSFNWSVGTERLY